MIILFAVFVCRELFFRMLNMVVEVEFGESRENYMEIVTNLIEEVQQLYKMYFTDEVNSLPHTVIVTPPSLVGTAGMTSNFISFSSIRCFKTS